MLLLQCIEENIYTIPLFASPINTTVTPSSTPPAAFSALLKEDGDAVIQENNDYILLEQQ